MREQTTYPKFFTRHDYKKESPEAASAKIEALIRAMTPEEKFGFLGGTLEPEDKGKIGNAGYQWGVPRLGIPESVLYDGPAGVTGIVETTGLPQPSLLGCTWDDDMAYAFGKVAASENAACGGNYQLSPQVDTIHSPHFVRNKDMKSEDSFLVAKLSAAETRATQYQNVIATVKHYAVANDLSGGPGGMRDNRVDEQTLHETYLLPFERTVKEGGAGSVMNSYNIVNGKQSTASRELNIDIMRDQWGFKGSLMADWGSVHEFTLNKGMDLEMPYSAWNNSTRILKNIARGRITWDEVDDAVRHILYGFASAGLLGLVELDENGEVKEDPGRKAPIQMEWRYEEAVVDGLLDRNAEAAAQIVREGAVLLKNDGVLPLSAASGRVALIGPGAKYPVCGQQQERSYGRLCRMQSGLEAMQDAVSASGAEITVDAEAYPGIDFVGTAIPADVLYQDPDCREHGVVRTYGILQEDAQKARAAGGFGGGGAAFLGAMKEDEDGELVNTGVGMYVEHVLGGKDNNTGGFAGIDTAVDFSTASKNYLNAEEGNALTEGAYTWKTYLKAPETGEYVLKLHCIGGNARFMIYADGAWTEIAESVTRENTQWPWDNVICTDTGMGINGMKFTMEAGRVYPVIVYAEHTVIRKDLQLRLAWTTPSQIRENREKALQAAAAADTILFYTVNFGENERMFHSFFKGKDKDVRLHPEQRALMADIIAAKRPEAKLVVIVQSSNARAVGDWADKADAILTAYHGGQEGARVLADILTGAVNPSGKLTQTWPKNSEDTPLTDTEAHYRERMYGIGDDMHTHLTEGIFFGYRWYDRYGVEPAFAFGHGLSYTTFAYSNLQAVPDGDGFAVSLDVTNTGERAGDEIVQIYLGAAEAPAYVQMAVRQLAGYARVKNLQPGETRRVEIPVEARSLCCWDTAMAMQTRADGTKDKWHRLTGDRKLYAAASSRDIRLETTITVQ